MLFTINPPDLFNRQEFRIPLSVDERLKLAKVFDYYGASGVIDKVDRFIFDKPLPLIGEDGVNLLLRSKPIAFIANGRYWVNNHAPVLDSAKGLLLEYVAVYINAINLAPYVTGTAQPKMNQEKMNPKFENLYKIVTYLKMSAEELLPAVLYLLELMRK